MRFLVTGSAGFIGYSLVKNLCELKHEVIGLDNLDNYYEVELKKSRVSELKKFKNFKFLETDLSKLPFKKLNIDVAINLAAQPGVRLPESKNDLYIHSNIDGFKSFLEFCKNRTIKKIIYASSSSVYASSNKIPYSESTDINSPVSFYAKTKVENENLARQFAEKYSSNVIGLRFFTVYGPYGRPDMAYFSFSKSIVNEQPIKLFNNGDLQRDMTFITDIVNGILNSINYFDEMKNNHEVFNLGNEKPIKTINLVKKIENSLNKKAKIINIFNINEVKITHADLTKSKKLLKYQPKIELEEGMNRFFDWFRDYYEI